MIDRFKREMGEINITQVAANVSAAVLKSLQSEVIELFGVTVVDFQINDIHFTDQYRKAADAAAIAKVKVEQSEQERRQAEINAQRLKIQAEGEANAVREAGAGQGRRRLPRRRPRARSSSASQRRRRWRHRPSSALQRCADPARARQALVRQPTREYVRWRPAKPHTRRRCQSRPLRRCRRISVSPRAFSRATGRCALNSGARSFCA